MISKSTLNCWDYQGCERQPGGRRATEDGICPAAIADELDGANGGTNGGRACWVVEDTLCGGQPSGPHSEKIHECRKCSFRRRVQVEQGMELDPDQTLLSRPRVSDPI